MFNNDTILKVKSIKFKYWICLDWTTSLSNIFCIFSNLNLYNAFLICFPITLSLGWRFFHSSLCFVMGIFFNPMGLRSIKWNENHKRLEFKKMCACLYFFSNAGHLFPKGSYYLSLLKILFLMVWLCVTKVVSCTSIIVLVCCSYYLLFWINFTHFHDFFTFIISFYILR